MSRQTRAAASFRTILVVYLSCRNRRTNIYVLHAFQKKSKKGIETPKREIEAIKTRLKVAEAHYRENYRRGGDK